MLKSSVLRVLCSLPFLIVLVLSCHELYSESASMYLWLRYGCRDMNLRLLVRC